MWALFGVGHVGYRRDLPRWWCLDCSQISRRAGWQGRGDLLLLVSIAWRGPVAHICFACNLKADTATQAAPHFPSTGHANQFTAVSLRRALHLARRGSALQCRGDCDTASQTATRTATWTTCRTSGPTAHDAVPYGAFDPAQLSSGPIFLLVISLGLRRLKPARIADHQHTAHNNGNCCAAGEHEENKHDGLHRGVGRAVAGEDTGSLGDSIFQNQQRRQL
mmetsp:Transcript_93376/g.280141  ORF Transcript_93376/g.280141 Transcript_93376/m.280141 type:complete len:221 (+) Transcript_93376:380-1042(+)